MPQWKSKRNNPFEQHDIYVAMTFLRSLGRYGFDTNFDAK